MTFGLVSHESLSYESYLCWHVHLVGQSFGGRFVFPGEALTSPFHGAPQ